MTAAARSRDAGLSLMELLVSLAILSVIGVASVNLLTTLIRTDEDLAQRMAELHRLDQAMSIIRISLRNADPATMDVTEEDLSFSVVPQLGGGQITLSLRDGTLQRVATRGEAELMQVLSTAILQGRWQRVEGTEGLLRLDLSLKNGLSGYRIFRVPHET